LLTDQDEISNLYRGPAIDASYQVGSFCQAVSEEKIKKKSANQKQELPMGAMFVNGSELNLHSFIEDLPRMLF
jgi:hypothetical protein